MTSVVMLLTSASVSKMSFLSTKIFKILSSDSTEILFKKIIYGFVQHMMVFVVRYINFHLTSSILNTQRMTDALSFPVQVSLFSQ